MEMHPSHEIFRCRCCGEDKPQDEASLDQVLGGPVCEWCRKAMIKAEAYLRFHGINRPVETSDINYHNCKRFSDNLGYK